MAKICGVYKITNMVNGKFYIGSSSDIHHRFYEHIYDLRNQIHANKHLQNAWDKYKENSFKFEIIEKCDPKIQFEREQYYLDELNPFDDNGYNIVRQISSDYISRNYIIKSCKRCNKDYKTFSNLSKYCDDCKEQIKIDNLERYKDERAWYPIALYSEELMYEPYGTSEYFWECN